MNNQNIVHPSRWLIRPADPRAAHCCTMALPLGPDHIPIIISSRTFNRVYEHAETQGKTRYAGDFANALRNLRERRVDLGSFKQVSESSVQFAYKWLELYEMQLSKASLVQKQETQAPIKKIEQQKRIRENAELFYQAYFVALPEYIRMFGPSGDPKTIVDKAKAVADETIHH